MGFFSGISKVATGLSGLAGGAKTSQAVPGQGFYTMPQGYQDVYGAQTSNILSQLFPNNQINTEMFTPLAQTGEETRALGLVNQGLAPTEQSIRSDISMLMNPFDDFVINDINRQSRGANSLVNQAATLAGQQGSNRSFLQTSDVEQNRLNSIGQFRQGQYNTALDQVLGKLAGLRQQDIQNLFGAGEFQRTLDAQTKQAPYTALSATGSLLSGLPTQFGSNYAGGTATSGSSAGSTFGKIAQGAQLAATVASLFSDKRLKMNIEPFDEKNGYKRYKFNYTHDLMEGINRPYIGVMAQDILEIDPMAVIMDESGYYKVDYNKIGFPMEEAA